MKTLEMNPIGDPMLQLDINASFELKTKDLIMDVLDLLLWDMNNPNLMGEVDEQYKEQR